MGRLKAENENLASELRSLRRQIGQHAAANGACIEPEELNALRTEKMRLKELVEKVRNDEQQKAENLDVVKELKAEKRELEGKMASLSVELERRQHSASDETEGELTVLRDEKRRLDSLVAHLEIEVQQHKDTAHEQRIRALDLKHELREVHFDVFRPPTRP